MKCIYHDDLDGRAAAVVAQLGNPGTSTPVEFIPFDYGDNFLPPPSDDDDTLYILDFMLEPVEKMEDLARSCHMVWIDHHATSKRAEEASPLLCTIAGVRDVSRATCELSWRYFFPDHPISPRAISLIGKHDRWDQSDPDIWSNEIVPFYYAMESFDTDPRSNRQRWSRLLAGDGIDDLIDAGRHIWRYQRRLNAAVVRDRAFEVEFFGFRGIAVNASGNSDLFESIWTPEKHDLMIAFVQTSNGRWAVALYSPKSEVDVSLIAEHYNGGGHRDAAGFGVDSIHSLLKVAS